MDVLIREDIFPRNAWDCPKQTINGNGEITVDWKIEGISGLKIIRFVVNHERVVTLEFFNGKEFRPFDPESDYSGYAWLVRQEMAEFRNFYTSYLKRVESN